MATKRDGDPTTYLGRSMAFDPEGRLTQYGTLENNGYTGDGLRIRQTVSGASTTYFVYDGSLAVAGVDPAGQLTSLHTFGANGLLSRARPSAVPSYDLFYTFDPQGSVAQE